MVAIAAGVIILLVRGFRVSDLTTPKDNVNTPSVAVWLVKVPDYTTKMDAYKAAYSHTEDGFGVYVEPENERWSWIVGVYDTEEEAETWRQNTALPTNVTSSAYQITGKHFTLKKELATTANQMLQLLLTIHQQLTATRALVIAGENTANAVLTLTDSYQQLRTAVDTLQTANGTESSPLLASLIYAGNQNILALFDVVFAEPSQANEFLSLLNTALIKNIFSLDNW